MLRLYSDPYTDYPFLVLRFRSKQARELFKLLLATSEDQKEFLSRLVGAGVEYLEELRERIWRGGDK